MTEVLKVYIAPNYEKCFMIPRSSMPQLDKAGVKAFLKKHDISNSVDIVHTESLKPTQDSFNGEKIVGMDSNARNKPILVSSDNYVLDGHHRWLSNHFCGDKTQLVIRLPWEAAESLKNLNSFEMTFNKDIHEDSAPTVSIGNGAIDNKVATKKNVIGLVKRKLKTPQP